MTSIRIIEGTEQPTAGIRERVRPWRDTEKSTTRPAQEAPPATITH